MLVITRKRDQTIVVGGCIVVKVLSRKGAAIRLGITAPPGIDIRRGELPPVQANLPDLPEPCDTPS